jgi:hypothetical protein
LADMASAKAQGKLLAESLKMYKMYQSVWNSSLCRFGTEATLAPRKKLPEGVVKGWIGKCALYVRSRVQKLPRAKMMDIIVAGDEHGW